MHSYGNVAAGYEMGLWYGPYPEEDIEAIAPLKRAINLARRDDLDVADIEWTAEHLRHGFKPYRADTMWQADVDRVYEYLTETTCG